MAFRANNPRLQSVGNYMSSKSQTEDPEMDCSETAARLGAVVAQVKIDDGICSPQQSTTGRPTSACESRHPDDTGHLEPLKGAFRTHFMIQSRACSCSFQPLKGASGTLSSGEDRTVRDVLQPLKGGV